MHLDRSRVPPAVARRLAVLAAHRTPVGARPAQEVPPAGHASADPPPRRPVGEDDPGSGRVPPDGAERDAGTGWTPRAPEAPRGSVAPTEGVVPGRDGPPPAEGPVVEAPVPGLPPRRDPGRPSADAELAVHGDDPWRPSVVSALADAAASRAPVPVPRVRWSPSWRAAGAAVLVLALVAGAIVLRAAAAPRGEPVPLPVPAPSGTGTHDAPAAADEVVVVHVVGAVAEPGVVRLALGSRVADAVAAAGGSSPDADLGTVNLARVLSDGEQLVVPVVGAAGAPAPDAVVAPEDGTVDLNTAPAHALEELPGVGPVLAGRIVERRTERPFTTVDELDEVVGIGPALLADLRARVRV